MTNVVAKEKLIATRSSGNVFLDLGFPPDEAENLLLRSTLMARITRIAREGGRTQALAAEALGIPQPRLILLLKGRIDEFNLDALENMFARVQGGTENRQGGAGPPVACDGLNFLAPKLVTSQ